jgi:hypothetical protein
MAKSSIMRNFLIVGERSTTKRNREEWVNRFKNEGWGWGLTWGGGFELGGEKYWRTLELPIPVAHHTRKGR